MDHQPKDYVFGTALTLLGAAAGAGLTALMGSPKEWADLIERLGLPTAMILILVVVFGAVIRIFGQPLVRTHMDLVASLKETAKANAEASRTNAEAVMQLKQLAEVQQATLMELLSRVKPQASG